MTDFITRLADSIASRNVDDIRDQEMPPYSPTWGEILRVNKKTEPFMTVYDSIMAPAIPTQPPGFEIPDDEAMQVRLQEQDAGAENRRVREAMLNSLLQRVQPGAEQEKNFGRKRIEE
jgi:hypothetical protein